MARVTIIIEDTIPDKRGSNLDVGVMFDSKFDINNPETEAQALGMQILEFIAKESDSVSKFESDLM